MAWRQIAASGYCWRCARGALVAAFLADVMITWSMLVHAAPAPAQANGRNIVFRSTRTKLITSQKCTRV